VAGGGFQARDRRLAAATSVTQSDLRALPTPRRTFTNLAQLSPLVAGGQSIFGRVVPEPEKGRLHEVNDAFTVKMYATVQPFSAFFRGTSLRLIGYSAQIGAEPSETILIFLKTFVLERIQENKRTGYKNFGSKLILVIFLKEKTLPLQFTAVIQQFLVFIAFVYPDRTFN